jgi:hypothetical protein
VVLRKSLESFFAFIDNAGRSQTEFQQEAVFSLRRNIQTI